MALKVLKQHLKQVKYQKDKIKSLLALLARTWSWPSDTFCFECCFKTFNDSK